MSSIRHMDNRKTVCWDDSKQVNVAEIKYVNLDFQNLRFYQ